MSESRELRKPAPLPENISNWQRQIKQKPTLNDMVEEIHRVLYDEDEKYAAFLEAVYDQHAVEGSLSADNHMAAALIRERAKKIGSALQKEKLAVISMALGVVLRRYKLSRKQRRRTVAGQYVPNDDDNGKD